MDKTDGREEYCRKVFKTVTLYGLNMDCFVSVAFMYFSREGCLHCVMHTSDIFQY